VIVQHAHKEPGAGDVGLSPRGQEQAEGVAQRLAGLPITAVYASPLRRARETAEPIARVAGRSVVEDERLRERMNWDGEESLEAFLGEWARATADRTYVPRWGESSDRVGERFSSLLEALAPKHRGELVVLVSHGGATVDLLRTLYGDDHVGEAAAGVIEQGVPHCALTHLRLENGQITLVAIASQRALHPPESGCSL
jgi:broad specificity phosphatase PhoE